MLLGFAGVVGMGAGIFAANINIGNASGGAIEFGTGNVLMSTCVDNLEISLTSEFVTAGGGAAPYFRVSEIVLTDIEVINCSGNAELTATLVNTDTTPTGLFTSTPFALPTAETTTIPTFKATIPSSNVVLSDEVDYVLVETTN